MFKPVTTNLALAWEQPYQCCTQANTSGELQTLCKWNGWLVLLQESPHYVQLPSDLVSHGAKFSPCLRPSADKIPSNSREITLGSQGTMIDCSQGENLVSYRLIFVRKEVYSFQSKKKKKKRILLHRNPRLTWFFWQQPIPINQRHLQPFCIFVKSEQIVLFSYFQV